MEGAPVARPAASVYPEDLRELVDEALGRVEFGSGTETAGLEEAMRHSLLAGGKRIRPVLCLATGRSVGLAPSELLPAACALELIHTYSLIHDDLPAMDDDALRRGQPTCHVVFGEDVAILAGDGLFAEAIGLLASQPGEPDRVLAAIAEVAAATGVAGMVGGQFVDVSAADLDLDGLRSLHQMKTGRLIEASVGVAVALAGIPEAETIPYRAFGSHIGLLFQIVDDILDVTGTDEELGKPQGSDQRHGKQTYVSAHGLDGARRMADEAHAAARAELDRASGQTTDLLMITDFIHTRSS